MGTFTYAAGISRPPELRQFPPARENLRATENRFNDYLDEARAPKVKPERDVDRAEDVRKDESEEAPKPEANDEAAPASDNAEQAAAESVASDVPADASVTVTFSLDGAAQTSDVDVATSTANADAQAKAVANQNVDRSNVQSRTTQSENTSQRTQTRTDATSQADDGQAARQQVTQPTRADETLQQAKTVSQTTDQAQVAENKASQQNTDGTQRATNADARPTREASDATNQQAESGKPKVETNRAQSNQTARETNGSTQAQPSLFEQKVDAAKTAERLGQSEYVVPGAATESGRAAGSQRDQASHAVAGKAATVDTDGAERATEAKASASEGSRLSKLLSEALGSADDNTPTGTIKTARGDSAALSTFRLLTDGAIDASRSQSGNHGATHAVDGASASSQASSARGLSAPNQAGQLVGQLLNASVEKADGAEALARLLNASSVPGRHQATLRLDPPELGQVNIRIDLKHEGLSLQVQAESREVARLLESRLTDLRDALATHGIRIERTDVVVQSNATNDAQLNNSTTDEQSNAATYADSQESNAQQDSQDTHRTDDGYRPASGDERGAIDDASDADVSLKLDQDEQPLLSETAVNLVA